MEEVSLSEPGSPAGCQTILGETQDEEDEILPRKDCESLDYDRCINEPYVEVLEGMNTKNAQKYEAVRWMLVFAIGVSVGLVGLFVDFFVRLFTKLKLNLLGKCIHFWKMEYFTQKLQYFK
uniref:Uncharacterized protein n=1 Tax=Salmo trutta TaxID=8032 RepID=A0A674CF22_SALTR